MGGVFARSTSAFLAVRWFALSPRDGEASESEAGAVVADLSLWEG